MTRPRWVRANTSARPPRPGPAEHRRQRTRRIVLGCVAVLTAALTAAVTDAVTGVVTNGLRGGWERVTGGESLFLNVAVLSGGGCGTNWLLPAGTGPAPEELTDPERLAEWARARDGTELPAPTVELTVRGRSGDVVVLRELRLSVVERRAVPSGDIVNTPCGGEQSVRTYTADLDRRPAVLQPEGDGETPPVPFPYRVTSSDAEVIRVQASTRSCDCRWVLDLVYVDGEQERTLRIDDGGRPFRTVNAVPATQRVAAPGTGP